MAATLRAGHHGSMESVLNVRPRQFRALGWAALFPAVMCLCFVCWGARPWTWIAVSAAAAVTLLAPAVAADLLAVALLGFASYAFALIGRNETLPPGSGTTTGYPFHSVVFGSGPPHTVDLAAGLLMLAVGAWLVPRTIGVHSRLARRNGDLLNRVRRLTITRVDAVDTAAAELRRIERDLHDGAQARLIALGISRCSPTRRAGSATCSRTGCSPTSSSPTRCVRWRAAVRSWTPRSSRNSWPGGPVSRRSPGSPTGNARCSS
jgi:signal transduction histidine kinase